MRVVVNLLFVLRRILIWLAQVLNCSNRVLIIHTYHNNEAYRLLSQLMDLESLLSQKSFFPFSEPGSLILFSGFTRLADAVKQFIFRLLASTLFDLVIKRGHDFLENTIYEAHSLLLIEAESVCADKVDPKIAKLHRLVLFNCA